MLNSDYSAPSNGTSNGHNNADSKKARNWLRFKKEVAKEVATLKFYITKTTDTKTTPTQTLTCIASGARFSTSLALPKLLLIPLLSLFLFACSGGDNNSGENLSGENNSGENNKSAQIDFAFIESNITKVMDDLPFAIEIIGGSGAGAINYESSNLDIASVDERSGEITIIATGTTTITATKEADARYEEARASFDLTVKLSPQRGFTFIESSITKVVKNLPFAIEIIGGSGAGAINYESSNLDVASVDGIGEITIASVGKTTITATKEADAKYKEARTSFKLTVDSSGAEVQTVLSFSNSSVDKVYADDTSFTITPEGGSGNGSFSYRSGAPNIASVDSTTGEVTLNGVGSTNIYVLKEEDRTYARGEEINYTLTVSKGNQSDFSIGNDITKSRGDNSFKLPISGNLGTGKVTYAFDTVGVVSVDKDGLVTIVGAGSVTITATIAADDNYNEASASITISIREDVSKDEQSDFSIGNNITKSFGDESFELPIDGNLSTGEVTYAFDPEGVVSVDKYGLVTIEGAGSVTITATIAADDNYNGTSASILLKVNKKNQSSSCFIRSGWISGVWISGVWISYDTVQDFGYTMSLEGDCVGTVKWSSDNSSLYVREDGTVDKELLSPLGQATITATITGDRNHDSLTINKYMMVSSLSRDFESFAKIYPGDWHQSYCSYYNYNLDYEFNTSYYLKISEFTASLEKIERITVWFYFGGLPYGRNLTTEEIVYNTVVEGDFMYLNLQNLLNTFKISDNSDKKAYLMVIKFNNCD